MRDTRGHHAKTPLSFLYTAFTSSNMENFKSSVTSFASCIVTYSFRHRRTLACNILVVYSIQFWSSSYHLDLKAASDIALHACRSHDARKVVSADHVRGQSVQRLDHQPRDRHIGGQTVHAVVTRASHIAIGAMTNTHPHPHIHQVVAQTV